MKRTAYLLAALALAGCSLNDSYVTAPNWERATQLCAAHGGVGHAGQIRMARAGAHYVNAVCNDGTKLERYYEDKGS